MSRWRIFPTLLIARGARVLFFGPVTPHAQTLARLVENALAAEARTQDVGPEVVALALRLAARDDAGAGTGAA